MSAGYDNRGFDKKDIENGSSGVHKFDSSQVQISFEKEGPWKRRSSCEKGLIFFLVIFVLAVIGLTIAVVRVKKEQDDGTPVDAIPVDSTTPASKTQEICETQDCALASARVVERMDMSVDPCEDFYMYSCGTWKRKNVIPEDRTGYSSFSELDDSVRVINKYLLVDTTSYTNVSGVQKAKDMYASCVDLELIEDKSTTVAIPLLTELGGWPVLGSNPGGNWSSESFSLPKLLITLRKYNNLPLIYTYIYSDIKDSENYIIYMDQSYFGLPGRLYYLDESLSRMREAYVILASSVAKLFGADEEVAERDMRDMLALETDLANITTRPEDRRDNELLYNKMTISELKQNFTEPGPTDPIQFNWLEYISGIFDLENVKIPVNESEPIVVVLYGTTSLSARWKGCVSYTVSSFGMAVGHMFVKETFDESAKTAALDMIENIRNAFNELLDEIEWMDVPTKELAREKAKAIREWIGYPDYVMEPEKINELYENNTIDRQEYFKNVLNNLRKVASDRLRMLRQKFDKNVWTTPPSTVNAFYSSILNTIMFPAGILQPPLYSEGQPKSMNYGAIGAIMGHEITHGFDDKGRQYDKDGNLKQWWNTSVISNFKEKAQCFIDQYSNFTVPEAGLNINGINTLGENIADNGGVKQSFRAYRKWIEERGSEEPILPGLKFTNNQLFFINYAQVWCNNIREEGIISAINNGVHSPGQFRVTGTLQNSPDFSATFGCKKNSFMNPQKRCYVW